MLISEFEGALVAPDSVDTHAAPAFLVDVVESDGLPFVGGLLGRCADSFGFVVRGDEIGAGSASCSTM